MKANRKFLKNDEDAVSPVIAVILMVAITVVLAATVYVWVSGFGAQSTNPAKSIALSSGGAIDTTDPDSKKYIVASASPGMLYSDMKFTLNGVEIPFTASVCAKTQTTWSACAGTSSRASTDVVTAGDTIIVVDTTPNVLSGKTLRILDPNSNSVILTLTVS